MGDSVPPNVLTVCPHSVNKHHLGRLLITLFMKQLLVPERPRASPNVPERPRLTQMEDVTALGSPGDSEWSSALLSIAERWGGGLDPTGTGPLMW